MELYFAPGACSLASHIALIESGIPYSIRKVDLQNHSVEGKNFRDINPKGAVPALKLNDNQILTENVAVLQYIADQHPQQNLAPSPTDFNRYRLQEWLSFLSSDIHKSFSPFFDPEAKKELKLKAEENLRSLFNIIDDSLRKSPFLGGNDVSVADFYLYVILTWVEKFELKLDRKQNIDRFFKQLSERPSVKEAKRAEMT